MIVRKLRIRNGWSQDQLAEFTGVTVRTIQRIERGQKPGLETAKALAAVFDVDCSIFTSEQDDMQEKEELKGDEVEAMEYAKAVKDYLGSLAIFCVLAVSFLAVFGFGEPVLYLVFGAMGIGLAVQGLLICEIIRLPFQNLERRIAEKKLGRKL